MERSKSTLNFEYFPFHICAIEIDTRALVKLMTCECDYVVTEHPRGRGQKVANFIVLIL